MRTIQLIFICIAVLLTSGCKTEDEVNHVVTGVLSRKEPNRIAYPTKRNTTISIGFTCESAACNQLFFLSLGDNFIAKFSVGSKEVKLVSIRKCRVVDDECRAVAEEMAREER